MYVFVSIRIVVLFVAAGVKGSRLLSGEKVTRTSPVLAVKKEVESTTILY